MVPFATLTFLCGAVLGIRFRVLVLVPATVIFCGIFLAAQFFSVGDLATKALNAALISFSLHLGYVFGLMTRSVLVYRPKQQQEALEARRPFERA